MNKGGSNPVYFTYGMSRLKSKMASALVLYQFKHVKKEEEKSCISVCRNILYIFQVITPTNLCTINIYYYMEMFITCMYLKTILDINFVNGSSIQGQKVKRFVQK